MNRLIIVTGQTATGKTQLALAFAHKHNGELISCDARQIYRYLDLVTGKDLDTHDFTHVEKLGNKVIGYYQLKHSAQHVPVWLYDIIEPDVHFSAYEYEQCALVVIKRLIAAGKTPIIVGGSYFYLRQLLYAVQSQPINPDWDFRNSLSGKSVKQLQDLLRQRSPRDWEAMNTSDAQNPRRLIRRLEILQQTDTAHVQVTHNTVQLHHKLGADVEVEIYGLRYADSTDLVSAIKKRVHNRVEHGALAEVKALQQRGYTQLSPGLQTIGYQQLFEYLHGRCTLDQAIQTWILREKQYAKRQYTFMKRNPDIAWQALRIERLSHIVKPP